MRALLDTARSDPHMAGVHRLLKSRTREGLGEDGRGRDTVVRAELVVRACGRCDVIALEELALPEVDGGLDERVREAVPRPLHAYVHHLDRVDVLVVDHVVEFPGASPAEMVQRRRERGRVIDLEQRASLDGPGLDVCHRDILESVPILDHPGRLPHHAGVAEVRDDLAAGPEDEIGIAA
jgi:hypothetical protein